LEVVVFVLGDAHGNENPKIEVVGAGVAVGVVLFEVLVTVVDE
jgi:hypothetical protein